MREMEDPMVRPPEAEPRQDPVRLRDEGAIAEEQRLDERKLEIQGVERLGQERIGEGRSGAGAGHVVS